MVALGRNGGVTPLWDGAVGIVTSQTAATTGNFHRAARLSDSWNAPSFVVASPI